MQKISSFNQFILEIEQILESRIEKPHILLTTTTQKLLKQLLAFLNFHQHTKNRCIQLIPSWDTANFRALRPKWPLPFFITPTPIPFDQPLISINLYQPAKNQSVSAFFSRNTVDLKILQSDSVRTFWPISQELDFSQVQDLYKNTAININFLHRPNAEKNSWLNFPINSKKPIFGSFFETNIFPKKIQLCYTKHHTGF